MTDKMDISEAFSLITEEYRSYRSEKPAVVVIAGPTASGKTSLSIRLAKELGGEIVSCDSMQIYKYMDIGTAKPTFEERSQAVHHMIDFLEPWKEYSTAEFCEDAKKCIKDIISRGKTPILSGGTGLYISSLIDNIEFTQSDPKEDELRAEYEKIASEQGIDPVYDILVKEDPEAAEAIHRNNIKRVIRAVVLLKVTGMTQKERNRLSREKESDYDFLTYILDPDRDVLYERIEKRVDDMIDQGLEDEVRRVLGICYSAYERGLSSSPMPSKTARQAIGYKEFIEYLSDEFFGNPPVEDIKINTRRYAKRQLTWLRGIENAKRLPIEY